MASVMKMKCSFLHNDNGNDDEPCVITPTLDDNVVVINMSGFVSDSRVGS